MHSEPEITPELHLELAVKAQCRVLVQGLESFGCTAERIEASKPLYKSSLPAFRQILLLLQGGSFMLVYVGQQALSAPY